MPFDGDKPFNDLRVLRPKAELETKAVLRRAIGANKALAELKSAGQLIPNQSVLTHGIGLQEAKLSAEIENVVVPAYFATRTRRYDMSNKVDFLNISQRHIQALDMFFGGIWDFILARYRYCAKLRRVCGAIPLLRQINTDGCKYETMTKPGKHKTVPARIFV